VAEPDPTLEGRRSGGDARAKGREADERAEHILRSVLSIAAEIALDLETTWPCARDTFANVLFERAERRYSSASRVAAALGTSMRLVKQYRSRRRRGPGAPSRFNARRQVLHALDAGPIAPADLERRFPVGSDVNFARSAVQSLVQDGMVVADRRSGRLRRSDGEFVPWYLRTSGFGARSFSIFCDAFAHLIGSRVTPRAEQGTFPAGLIALMANVPRADLKAYVDELLALVADFDRRWQARSEAAPPEAPRVRAGGVLALGELGEPIAPEAEEELQRLDPAAVTVDDEVLPTYRSLLGDQPRVFYRAERDDERCEE
jgi:hypothetical protein